VTAKEVPNDADAVVLLGPDFATRIARGNVDAILLAEVLDSQPNDICSLRKIAGTGMTG
jgi:hypothetical protein